MNGRELEMNMSKMVRGWVGSVLAAMALCVGVNGAAAGLVASGGNALDTETGLEWLNLKAANGLSQAQILSGAGGFLAGGWRYATTSEVAGLAQRYVGAVNGGYGEATSGMSKDYQDAAESFVLLMGMNLGFNDSRANYNVTQYPGLWQISSQGWFMDADPTNLMVGLMEVTAVLSRPDSMTGAQYDNVGRWKVSENWSPATTEGPFASNWMVRVSAVPEPSTLSMFGVAIACALALSKRKRI